MNTIENIIISAVNEYEGAYNVKDLDEATDILSYEEITELCLFYIKLHEKILQCNRKND